MFMRHLSIYQFPVIALSWTQEMHKICAVFLHSEWGVQTTNICNLSTAHGAVIFSRRFQCVSSLPGRKDQDMHTPEMQEGERSE